MWNIFDGSCNSFFDITTVESSYESPVWISLRICSIRNGDLIRKHPLSLFDPLWIKCVAEN